MSFAEIFHEITAALDQARIPYMLVGSFASNLYGTGRATQDIDIVVSATPDQIRMLLSLLPTATYYFDLDSALGACRRKDMFNILDMQNGWKIDIIFENESWGSLRNGMPPARLLASINKSTPSYTLVFRFRARRIPHGLIRRHLRAAKPTTLFGRTQRPASHSQRKHRARA